VAIIGLYHLGLGPQNTQRAIMEGNVIWMGPIITLHVQNREVVHLSISSVVGTEDLRAIMEVVHYGGCNYRGWPALYLLTFEFLVDDVCDAEISVNVS
jgi:hypothetical protein